MKNKLLKRDKKKCSCCKEIKELSEFYKNKSKYDGLTTECKKCIKKYHNKIQKQLKIYNKSYYEKNKEYFHKKFKEYYKKYKEELKKSSKNYYEKNKKRLNKYKNEYDKRKRKIDIIFKLLCNVRIRLSQVLKNNKKSLSMAKLLGCTIDELRLYLKSQFKEGMTWDNYGTGYNGKGMQEWHIDHIKPCASFDLSVPKQQQECFHYTNLQPLWAEENRKKLARENNGI